MIKIGDFSKLSRISIRMLRHYAEMGLLIPEKVDPFTGYRYYYESQLPIANRITALKDMGFSLSAVGEILSHNPDPYSFERYLKIKRAEIQEQADAAGRRLRLLDTALERLRKDGTMLKYDVTQKEIPELYAACVRQIIPTYAHEGTLWKILMEETAPMGLHFTNPCYVMAVFHDKEFKETDVDVEVRQSVQGNYPNTKNVTFHTVPPVLVASTTYKGPYEQMTEVNKAVADWIRDNGYQFAGAAFNIYHVSPHETDNPEEYVTEVCYPIAKV